MKKSLFAIDYPVCYKQIMDKHFEADIQAIQQIAAVPTILDVVCQTTGMGFAAVARVTEDKWIACSVRDDIDFGLKPGGELEIKSTICYEIQSSHELVVIDHVSEDALYCNHHTPARYGFESYISVPILLEDGSMFGTLCAIDPKPAQVNNAKTIGMFKLFAELIGFHLTAQLQMIKSQEKLAESLSQLTSVNQELEEFSYSVSHDLRTPLRAIDGYSQLLTDEYAAVLDDKGRDYIDHVQTESRRMGTVIDNLTSLAWLTQVKVIKKQINLSEMFQKITPDFQKRDSARSVSWVIQDNVLALADERLTATLLQNLISNAWKFTSQQNAAKIEFGSSQNSDGLATYFIRDNGAGFNMAYSKKLYLAFQRLHNRNEFPGLGIGLAIVQRIIHRHGGRVWAESELGKGATFYFTLPS
jgi:signal transduction histidine kinase